jgi:anti-sigma-K factor RskA
MTHEDLRELSGGYALGALNDDDRRAFEAHLSACAECANEVRELKVVAAGLSQAVPQVSPPAALRARVLAAATAADNRQAARATPSKSGVSRLLGILSAAAAIAAIALGLYAVSLQQRIRTLEQELRLANARANEIDKQLVQYRVAADRAVQIRAILAAPDLRRIDLAGQKAAPAAFGRAFWSPTEGLAVAFDRLPPTADGRVYQLWVIPPGGTPISAALLDLQADGTAIALGSPASSSRVGTVAVTIEPAGGVPQPTGDMIVAGTLAN